MKFTDKIKEDLINKYSNFKMSDDFPNIYETFLTSMFNICDCDDNDKNTYNQIYWNYLRAEKESKNYTGDITYNTWEFGLQKYNININNIFRLKFDTIEDINKI
jgi:hypothetical protein